MGQSSSLSRVAAAVALAVVGVGASGWLALPGRAAGAQVSGATACRTRLTVRVLPIWARGGFSEPKPRMPYVLGAAGGILAILWADPLRSPPPRTHANKILWVSRRSSLPPSDLRISAQRMIGATAVGAPVSRVVAGGPGPSIVNLPAPGCWRLRLRWSGRADTLDLRYAASR